MSEPVDQAAGEGSAEQPLTVGAQLRKARRARGVELDKVAQALRIESPSIEALEADRFDAFSAPVFAKGYLKRYADYLGLNPDDLLLRYYQQVGREEMPVVGVSAPIKLRDDRQVGVWIVAVLLLLIVALAGLFWWRSGADRPPPPQNSVAPLVDPEPPVELVPPQPAEAAAETATEGVLAPPPEAAPAAGNDQLAGGGAAAQPPAAPATLSIELAFTEDCWAEVTDGSGARLFYGLGRAGASSRFAATPPVSFLLGNVSGVQVSVDGATYEVPRANRQGNLARFVLLETGD